MKKRYSRGIIISLSIIIISFFNFSNLEGTECIRAIHVVTLLVAGMGIGVLLTNLFGWIREKRA